MNGRNANNDSDDASVPINQSGSIAGTIWADSNNSGWSGTTGYNAGDTFLANTQIQLYACISNYTGLIITTPGNTARECTNAANNGQWVLVDTTTTNSNGSYTFTGLRDGYYNVKVVESTLPATFTTRGAETTAAGNGAGITCGTCDGQWNTDAANLNTFNNIVNGGSGENITNVSFGYRNLSSNGDVTGYV